MKKAKVIAYYDEYTDRQAKMGINARHLSIQKNLERFGLQKDHNVLEIGCGIGTQTKLLAEYLNPTAKITANDISPKSVEVGRKALSKHKNIEWVAADILEHPIDFKYDVVLLPDVIEHIPVELHKALFGKIKAVLKEDGFVLIHIPQPYYQEWCHVHLPEKLQVIDQSIYTDELVANTYPHGLYISHLETYSIWMQQGEYQVIVLKPRSKNLHFELKKQNTSIVKKIVAKSQQILNR